MIITTSQLSWNGCSPMMLSGNLLLDQILASQLLAFSERVNQFTEACETSTPFTSAYQSEKRINERNLTTVYSEKPRIPSLIKSWSDTGKPVAKPPFTSKRSWTSALVASPLFRACENRWICSAAIPPNVRMHVHDDIDFSLVSRGGG
jgi:hypothetical protein